MDSKSDPWAIVALVLIFADDGLHKQLIDHINAQAEMFRRSLAYAMDRNLGET